MKAPTTHTMGEGNRGGFTMVEVIVALVLIGFAGAILSTLVSRATTQANRPRETLALAVAQQAVMEAIVARHAALDDVGTLSGEIGAEGSSANNSFGRYSVVHNRFIEFDIGNQETAAAGTNRLLKVSIQNTSGETITRLFSENG